MPNLIAAGFSAESTDGELASLEASLVRLEAMGADAVELGLSSIDLVTGGRVVAERLDRLAALTARFSFRYTVHGLVSSNFMDPETLPFQLAAAKALVEACDRIGARLLVQHGGALRADQIQARADADRRERAALFDLSDFARRYDVRVALENIFTTEEGQYRQTPAEVAATVRAVDHPNLVALIDFSHAYIESTYKGLDFVEQVRAMAPVAGHLHVHDSFGRPIGRYQPFYDPEATALGLGDLHMPLGWGDIDWDSLFGELDFLPETVVVLEIGERYRAEQAASLVRARELMRINAGRSRPAQAVAV